jgi:tetrahydromethanopterin S-methyltransferase subunit G
MNNRLGPARGLVIGVLAGIVIWGLLLSVLITLLGGR